MFEVENNYGHKSTLQMFTGIYGVPIGFSVISIEKGCKKHRETLYSSQEKIVYVAGKPCSIYRLRGNPYDNCRISLQSVNITGFPTTYTIFLFEEYRVSL